MIFVYEKDGVLLRTTRMIPESEAHGYIERARRLHGDSFSWIDAVVSDSEAFIRYIPRCPDSEVIARM